MIYLDNGATSNPKPESVYKAVENAVRNCSGNPGRSGHKVSLAAGKAVEQTRILLSQFFNTENAESIVYALNATDALNMAIYGVLKPGDHAITSMMEHNSVARPMKYMEEIGVEVTKIPADLNTGVDPEAVRAAIKDNTKLVAINHVSNVSGTVNDAEKIGQVCKEMGVLFLLDASQSAGTFPIDVQKWNIDLLAFPGHKSLMGPQGTGGLYIKPGTEIAPFRRGGTGSKSELLTQPDFMPDRFESGTLNVPGAAGLGAGVQFIMDEGIDKIAAKEKAHVEKMITALSEIPGVNIISPAIGYDRGAVLSFTVDGLEVQEISFVLDQMFDIAVRSGLHCSPDAHRNFGTFDNGGTVRVSPGYFTTDEEIDTFIGAIKDIISEMS